MLKHPDEDLTEEELKETMDFVHEKLKE